MKEQSEVNPHAFEYAALNGFPAVCELRMFEHQGQTIVVATDLDVGPSVTNNVERIATLLYEQGIQFDLFCEHYLARPEADREEIFDWVTFTWRESVAVKAAWKHATREAVEAAIGQTFS